MTNSLRFDMHCRYPLLWCLVKVARELMTFQCDGRRAEETCRPWQQTVMQRAQFLYLARCEAPHEQSPITCTSRRRLGRILVQLHHGK